MFNYMHGETSYIFLFFKIFQDVERTFKLAGTPFQVQPTGITYQQKSGLFDQFFLTWSLSRI